MLSAMRPLLVVNPRSDATFDALVNRLVAEGVQAPADLQRELRERYPKAIVRERTLSAEPLTTWYVYREGSWLPNS